MSATATVTRKQTHGGGTSAGVGSRESSLTPLPQGQTSHGDDSDHEKVAEMPDNMRSPARGRTTRATAIIEPEIDPQYLDENGYLRESAVKRENRRRRRHSVDNSEIIRNSPRIHNPDLSQEVADDDLSRAQPTDDGTIERAFGNMTDDERARVEARQSVRGDRTPADSVSTTASMKRARDLAATFRDAVTRLDSSWRDMPWAIEKELRVIIINAKQELEHSPYYDLLLDEIQEALANFETNYPLPDAHWIMAQEVEAAKQPVSKRNSVIEDEEIPDARSWSGLSYLAVPEPEALDHGVRPEEANRQSAEPEAIMDGTSEERTREKNSPRTFGTPLSVDSQPLWLLEVALRLLYILLSRRE
jgi:hypothetical protein